MARSRPTRTWRSRNIWSAFEEGRPPASARLPAVGSPFPGRCDTISSAMRAVTRRVAPLLALLATCSAAPTQAGQSQPSQDPQPAQPPRIRVSVDVIPVDVQVLDKTGHPVPNLGPEKFSVTIN